MLVLELHVGDNFLFSEESENGNKGTDQRNLHSTKANFVHYHPKPNFSNTGNLPPPVLLGSSGSWVQLALSRVLLMGTSPKIEDFFLYLDFT